MIRTAHRLLPVAALAVCAALSGIFAPRVNAQVDPTASLYFRSQSFLGFQPAGSSGFLGFPPGGIDLHESNTAPANTSWSVVDGEYSGAIINSSAWSVYNGFYSARNYASLAVANIPNEGVYTIGGQGSRTRVEFFTPEALATRSTFTWRVTGTESTSDPLVRATGRLDFMARTTPGSFYDLFNTPGTLSVFGPGTYTYNLPTVLDQPIDLYYWSSAFVELDQPVAAGMTGESFSGFANYGNTHELEKIELFDANDVLLTNWTMVDLSTGQTVFNQNGRVTSSSAVPEPTTLALLALGGALLMPRRRRRR